MAVCDRTASIRVTKFRARNPELDYRERFKRDFGEYPPGAVKRPWELDQLLFPDPCSEDGEASFSLLRGVFIFSLLALIFICYSLMVRMVVILLFQMAGVDRWLEGIGLSV